MKTYAPQTQSSFTKQEPAHTQLVTKQEVSITVVSSLTQVVIPREEKRAIWWSKFIPPTPITSIWSAGLLRVLQAEHYNIHFMLPQHSSNHLMLPPHLSVHLVLVKVFQHYNFIS